MIIVDLSEGLGNQMFQYAFARNLQERCHEPIYLNTRSYKRNQGTRQFSLYAFVLNEEVECGTGIKEFAYDCYMKIYRKLIRKKVNTKDANAVKPYETKGFYVYGDVFGYVDYLYNCEKKNKYVMGSWMNPGYCQWIREKLIHDFTIKIPMAERNVPLLNEIRQKNAVCVHVRLGDYLSPKWSYLNVCTSDYYNKAMEQFADQLPKPTFYIFSNSTQDLQWIRENYLFLSKFDCRFVDQNNCDYEELELMVNCRHFIISNSTFSWWAQFLCTNPDKRVIAPRVWSRTNEGCQIGYDIDGITQGIYQDSWEILDVWSK